MGDLIDLDEWKRLKLSGVNYRKIRESIDRIQELIDELKDNGGGQQPNGQDADSPGSRIDKSERNK